MDKYKNITVWGKSVLKFLIKYDLWDGIAKAMFFLKTIFEREKWFVVVDRYLIV